MPVHPKKYTVSDPSAHTLPADVLARIAAGEDDRQTAPRGSLMAKREKGTLKYVRDILFSMAGTPGLRDGRSYQQADIDRLVEGFLAKESSLPAGTRSAIRTAATEMLQTIVVRGDKLTALEGARAAAVAISRDLARSAWDPDDDSEAFVDPRAIAAAIGRNRV